MSADFIEFSLDIKITKDIELDIQQVSDIERDISQLETFTLEA